MDKITQLIETLSKPEGNERVRNQYTEETPRKNLEAYLRAILAQPQPRTLMVGEAAGYRGCALSGIPFTSERILREGRHPLLKAIAPEIQVNGDTSENSATIIWSFLDNYRVVPALWNAFPFHPHEPGNQQTNRKPTQSEISLGKPFLHAIVSIINPEIIIGIGEVGYSAARDAGLSCERVRHPSYGGKADFCEQCGVLLGGGRKP